MLAALSVITFTIVNILDVRLGTRTQNILTVAKSASAWPLCIVVGFGWGNANNANVSVALPAAPAKEGAWFAVAMIFCGRTRVGMKRLASPNARTVLGTSCSSSAYAPVSCATIRIPVRSLTAGVTQWHWWQSFVGNVLGTATHPGINGYEAINPSNWGGTMWMVCWQNNDNVGDGGKCQSTLLRDGDYNYVTKEVHWHGVGGTGVNNGLTAPANSTLPASMYLTSKPAFFGSNPWPWVDGSNATNPVPGQLPSPRTLRRRNTVAAQ